MVQVTNAERIAHALAQHHNLRHGYEQSPAWEMYLRWGQVAADAIEEGSAQ